MYYIIRKDIRVKHDEMWDRAKAKNIAELGSVI